MWWQDSVPRTEIRVAKDQANSKSTLSEALEALAELVESDHAADRQSDKRNFKTSTTSATAPPSIYVDLVELQAKVNSLERQLVRALANASKTETQQKRSDAEISKAKGTASSAKLELADTKQKYDAEIQRIQVSIIAKDRQLQKRESYFSDQLAQARNAQRETEKQNAHLIGQHAKASTKLKAMIAAYEQSATERDSTTGRLQASLAEHATKIVELEQLGHDAEIKLAQSRNAQLETEKQKSQLIELHATATAELEAMIAAYEHSATERDSTIGRLQASLAEHATKIVELEQLGHDAEIKLAQSKNAQLETEKQKSQLIELHGTATAELEAMIAAHEHSATERDSTIGRLQVSLGVHRSENCQLQQVLNECQQQYSAHVQKQHYEADRLHDLVEEQKQCAQTFSQLQEQSTQLQYRLQHEAASRRKAEAALKQAVENANDDPVLVAMGVRFETVQRIERLSNELKATRRLCMSLQQQAGARAKQSQKSINV